MTRFRPGDAVFGEKSRGCAEYVSAPGTLVPKPAKLTFEEAAAIPAAGVTALQALRDKGRIQPGQKVLINGASGGVGTFAVRIAKADGAAVTGVCSTPNVELVRSLGADRAIDYTREDFARTGDRYDLIIDNVGNRSLRDLRRVLSPDGTLVMVGAPRGRWILGFVANLTRRRSSLGSPVSGLLGHLTDTRTKDSRRWRSRGTRQGQAGRRPVLPAEPNSRRAPVPRDAARPREGHRHRSTARAFVTPPTLRARHLDPAEGFGQAAGPGSPWPGRTQPAASPSRAPSDAVACTDRP